MPLHPHLAERFASLQGVTMADVARAMNGDDPELAGRLRALLAFGDWAVPSGLVIEDAVVGAAVDVPVRVYRPAGNVERCLVWAHGGGFISGDLDMGESHVVCAELAARASATVIAVDYRLAGGGVVYPAPIDDVEAVIVAARELAGAEDDAALAVGGASAGAALAVAATLRNPDAIDLLVLGYPFLHFPLPPVDVEHQEEMDSLPPLFRSRPDAIEHMVQSYVGRLHGIPTDALPGAAPLSGAMPATRIVVAEYDDFRSSGELLQRQWAQAGVDVELHCEPGVTHGFLNGTPAMPGSDDALSTMARWLRAARRRNRAEMSA